MTKIRMMDFVENYIPEKRQEIQANRISGNNNQSKIK